ncbi:hypothetical protein FIBSPDRAFT_895156 [Athelia psychrophila]|uniref:Uncharacterized protein n=1 Tax=Athelia psychrophila TaxID=1759441 RepID=A0A166EZ72_9AGAM|nr:hypothetical protein FIBSPDRAFT_895156 [Fibularhizoctonia sp. CBS 109695]
MANTSCAEAFPSISDLLNQADAGLNISAAVSNCSEICSIAWGAGDPDLSGIGLIICYIIQAVVTLFSGPFFCIYYYRSHKDFSPDKQRRLGELHDTILDAIAQFSVPVVVAAFISVHHDHPPFYEIDFIHSLTTMQLLSLFSTAFTASIFDKPRKSTTRIIVICVYGLLDLGFYIGIVMWLLTTPGRWAVINELGKACNTYGNTLLPGFGIFQERSVVGTIFGVIMICVAGSLAVAVVAACCNVNWIWLAGLMSLASSIGMVVELLKMKSLRDSIRGIAGSDFEDNDWGFAQVVAMFLWVPVYVGVYQYYFS